MDTSLTMPDNTDVTIYETTNYVPLAIFVTLCCNPCLGTPAIIYAYKSGKCENINERRKRSISLFLSICSLIVGSICAFIFVLCLVKIW
ncbi:hypothetical protein A3Q56_05125 [Intoshia linei]|uniref:Transmembrane protein 233 n=1 Tax=Intoshia linei TaxID=1819745 RepID=A0A177B0J7_9BILA|nr:hypothetical protein A3Q56_05125 [Intoshia linei]